MELVKRITAIAAAATMVATPIAAQAAAGVDAARAGSEVEGENLRGGFGIPMIVLIAVALGLLILLSSDDDDAPVSP